MTRRCSVSVDLDGIDCYFAIHGLGRAPAHLGEVVLGRALPRFLELFARHRVAATLFVVARDLEAYPNALSQAVRAGHEIGNHSYSHAYDLAYRSPVEIEAEVRQAHEILSRVTGPEQAPVGFRAPGYGLSPRLLQVLVRSGYRYDSSVLPSWPYYLAKAGVMGFMRAVGRRSAAVMHSPYELLASAEPYRPDLVSPWRCGDSPIVEFPVTVTPWLRLPAIGTTFVVSPRWVREAMLRGASKRSFFNLELHGLELCDGVADGLPGELIAKRADLRVNLEERIRRLDEVLERVSGEFGFARLRDVAGDRLAS